jgi:diketogulonate reductase-like aldo/keto reductase
VRVMLIASMFRAVTFELSAILHPPSSSINKRAGGPVDKPVADIAERLGVSIDQVLLAWAKAKDSIPVT